MVFFHENLGQYLDEISAYCEGVFKGAISTDHFRQLELPVIETLADFYQSKRTVFPRPATA